MPLRSALLASLVAVIWGVNFVVIDVGIADMPPTLFVAIRFVAVLIPAIFFVPRPSAPLRDVLLVGVFMSLGQFGLLYTALALGMPAGLASLVLQAQVVLTVLFAALILREAPSGGQLLGVTVGVIGLTVVALGRGSGSAAGPFVVTLCAAASWAVGNVIARRVGRSAPTAGLRPGAGLSLTVWSALVVPGPMLALAFISDGVTPTVSAILHISPVQLLSTAYTAWLASLVGYAIWNTLLARYPAAAVVPFIMLVPPVGLISAWIMLGETPTAGEIAGGIVLLCGVALSSGRGMFDRRRRQEARPYRVITATANADRPSPAPVNPSPSVVVAVTETAAPPSADESTR